MDVDEDVLLIDYPTPVPSSVNKTEVIETIDVTEYQSASNASKKRKSSNIYNKNLCKDNKSLTDFINKCIFLDQTAGMETIIKGVLLAAYVKADMEYKQSEAFKRVVTKAFKRLLDDPDRKYTHISDIVDTLKIHAAKAPEKKKRANLITLSTKVTVKPNNINRKRPSTENSSKIGIKKSKPEVIALDDDDNDDDDVVTYDKDDEGLACNGNVSGDKLINQETSSKNKIDKVNEVNDDIIENKDIEELNIIEKNIDQKIHNNQNDEPTINEISNDKEYAKSVENLNDENCLLVPQKEVIVKLDNPKSKKKKKKTSEMTEKEKAYRIKVIEATIAKHNNTIAKLDLEEVTDDDTNSPYYKCDRLRALIVKLYKELRTLVGEGPPEKRKIRLQTAEGLPQGPIKRLEKLLNKQANEDGDTPFPDFSDVMQCVVRANLKDGLGWSKAKVFKEAQAIFTYCGRALQRRRQRREWKHLQAQVKPEEFEDDPADRDQALQTRLEANRRLAQQREAEVFNKFARMESDPTAQASASLHIEEDASDPEENNFSDDGLNNSSVGETVLKTNQTLTDGEIEMETNNGVSDTFDPSIVKEEPAEIKIQYKGDISLVIEISDSESDDDDNENVIGDVAPL